LIIAQASKGGMPMVDNHSLRTHNWRLPDPEPEEEQESPEPVVVDFVYNVYEEQKGKTIALKLSLHLPLKP
jgi:hypothetical protein